MQSLVNALLRAAEQKTTFTPKKGSKDMGTIHVDQCKITGADSPQPTMAAASAPSTLPMPVPVPVEQMGNMSLGGVQRPSFVDYVTGNCDLGLVRPRFRSLLQLFIVHRNANRLYSHFLSVWLSTLREAMEIPANLEHCTTLTRMD